jgi:hypothetical protein
VSDSDSASSADSRSSSVDEEAPPPSSRRPQRRSRHGASRQQQQHHHRAALHAPHPHTPPSLYRAAAAAPPYAMLLTPPGSPGGVMPMPMLPPSPPQAAVFQSHEQAQHMHAMCMHMLHQQAQAQRYQQQAQAQAQQQQVYLAADSYAPQQQHRPSAPLDPGYALAAAAYSTRTNAMYEPGSNGMDAASLAAAMAADLYARRNGGGDGGGGGEREHGSPQRSAAPQAPWPAFSPPQAPTRARTPRHGGGGRGMPAASPLPTREQALRSLARELDAATAAAEAHNRRRAHTPVSSPPPPPPPARQQLHDSDSGSESELAAPRMRIGRTGVDAFDDEDDAGTAAESDAFENYVDDASGEWSHACQAEAAHRQRSPSASAALTPPRPASRAGHESRLERPSGRAGHRRTLTLG